MLNTQPDAAISHHLYHHAYALDAALLRSVKQNYGVIVVDDTDEPHNVCFGGSEEGLKQFFIDFFSDLYEPGTDIDPVEMGILMPAIVAKTP